MNLEEIIRGKKILFICPEFHHYHISIQKKLRQKGGEVYFVPTYNETLTKRLLRQNSRNKITSYYNNRFDKVKDISFDYLFQIKGEDIDYDLLDKQVKKSTISLMYQWDSLTNCNYLSLIPLFNKAYSFDRNDTRTVSQLKHLQLFYEGNNVVSGKKYDERFDLLTVAGYTHWRYEQVHELYKLGLKHRLATYIKLFMPLKTLIRLWFSGKAINLEIITFKKVNRNKYHDLLLSSSTVLDVPSHQQTGLSIRTVEALGMGKKLITTNDNIRNESFFDEDVIFVLEDKFNEEEVIQFIKDKKSKNINIESLELENWLTAIFDVNI